MEEEIKKWKIDFEAANKMEELLKNKVFGREELEESKKAENIKMLDLKTQILYGEKYFEIFIQGLVGTDIVESEKKYNIERINKHLEKILEQYTQMTNELDEIIFNEKKQEETMGKFIAGYCIGYIASFITLAILQAGKKETQEDQDYKR